MESHGLYFNATLWRHHLESIRQQLKTAALKAQQLLGQSRHLNLFGEYELNLDSGLEVKKALEQVLGRHLPDTNHATLAEIQHPAPKALLEYRELAKLVQTYGDSFLEYVDPKTNRIHAHFEPEGTSTGRVSCHSPNLQNLPSLPEFQACLIPPAGRTLVTGDYAACELRVLAHFSQDPTFLKAFEEDRDLHAEVARELFGSAEHRSKAKAINFGLIYGMGAKSLARSLDVPVHQAEHILHRYFEKHPRINGYLKWCVQFAYERGYAETRLGRRLQLDKTQDISRIAKNMPIQGTAAEIAKLAMIKVHERLEHDFKDAFLVNMIHDELVIECAEQDVDAVMQMLKTEMESAEKELIPRVKPKAEVGRGDKI